MRAKATVILMGPDGGIVTVRPGDEFPEWAHVTNPDAIEDEPAEAPRKPVARTRKRADDE